MLALGEEEAAEVMKYLGPREVQKLGAAMSTMKAVASEQLEAVRRGLGVAVLPRVLAQDLIELFTDLPLPDLEVYLVTRPQALKQPHIRGFFSSLEAMLQHALGTDHGQHPPGQPGG